MPQGPQSVQSPFDDPTPSAQAIGKIGKVFLVGAGPGDPGLITVRGAECLSRADVVLYDGLANPRLLALAQAAELISVGKHGHGPLWTQDEINRKLVELARSGRCVVRLKGGDPAVFARTAEELETLCTAGIPFEVVPGITAALAAASYVGIPITHRDHASAVAFITGQQQNSGAQELDWAALARFPGTLVFYMGVTTAAQWSRRLIDEGKPGETPAAIVRRCTWSDQRVIRCQLADIAQQLTPASKLRPPVIVIIGAVAQLGCEYNWFDALPLRGQLVCVTRPADQNVGIAQQLEELGAEVIEQPMISIEPPEDWHELDRAIDRLGQRHYQGVAFTSRNAVHALLDRIWHRGLDSRTLAGATIACVGGKTAEALAERGLSCDIVPTDVFDAEHLAAAILKRQPGGGGPWLLPLADQATTTLQEALMAAGTSVDRVTAYRSVSASRLRPELVEALSRGGPCWITITSANIARTAHRLAQPWLGQLQPVSLSPAISRVLSELGWPAKAEASTATEEALLKALQSAVA